MRISSCSDLSWIPTDKLYKRLIKLLSIPKVSTKAEYTQEYFGYFIIFELLHVAHVWMYTKCTITCTKLVQWNNFDNCNTDTFRLIEIVSVHLKTYSHLLFRLKQMFTLVIYRLTILLLMARCRCRHPH